MKENITACIDGSAISASVCDVAAWASAKLDAPLKFLHVLEKPNTPAKEDLSGAIGLGSREHLLDELIELDAKRGKLAIEHGKHMLTDAKQRAEKAGAKNVISEQRHGELLDTLMEYQDSTRLFVIGRLGEGHDLSTQTVGSHVESVARSVDTPILVAVDQFCEPERFMIAYDGSGTANNAIARIANSPLLKNLAGHVVMVGSNTPENQNRLQAAMDILSKNGHQVEQHLIAGEVKEGLESFQKQHRIDLKVMGAYGHSRIREFFVGSNSSWMIAHSPVPLLLMR